MSTSSNSNQGQAPPAAGNKKYGVIEWIGGAVTFLLLAAIIYGLRPHPSPQIPLSQNLGFLPKRGEISAYNWLVNSLDQNKVSPDIFKVSWQEPKSEFDASRGNNLHEIIYDREAKTLRHNHYFGYLTASKISEEVLREAGSQEFPLTYLLTTQRDEQVIYPEKQKELEAMTREATEKALSSPAGQKFQQDMAR